MAVKPIVTKKRDRPKLAPLENDAEKVFVCRECGREQSAPEDPDEAVAFARQIGWRANVDGMTWTCPFCVGGDNLAALKAVFEGRGKERLS